MTLSMLVARLRAMSPKSLALVGIAVAVAAAAAVACFSATRDTRTALFAAPLVPEQVAEVQNRLAAWDIPFAPTVDNIRVAPEKRNAILLRLSLAGVPHAHLATSADVFTHAGALTPQAILDAQTRDGLAGDLATGLRGIDGVADARVIIAPARAGIYADEPSHDASASVRITLVPGAHLAARALTGIRAFVASGVPGLEPARVTVLDDAGLAVDATAAGDPASGDDGVERALQSALDTAFGAGAAIVRVHRDPYEESRELRDVRRSPLGGVLARSIADERYHTATKTYSKNGTVEDRGSDVHDETLSRSANATKRRTVAIFVDAARNLDVGKIRLLASASAGIDESRGDVVTVEALPFAASPAVAVAHPMRWELLGAFAGIVPQAIVALAIVAVLALGAKPAFALATQAIEAATVRTTARDVAGIPPLRVRGVLAGEPPHIAAAIISALPAATATAVLELYAPDERAAIVGRLARSASPLVPDAGELLRARS